MSERDFLDQAIDKYTAEDPEFPQILEAAKARRHLLQVLAAQRRMQGLTQTQIAAAMKTSQSSLARLESGGSDTRLSTLERFAAALGVKVQFRLLPADSNEPLVIPWSET